MKRCLALVLFVALSLVPTLAIAQQPTPKPSDKRCIIPDQPVIDWISQGFPPEYGVYLRHVWAVKSKDFENVWFVAGDLEGPDMDGNDQIGVWATNALTAEGQPQPGGGGAVFSVDGFAHEFSDWPHSDVQDISRDDDGYKQAHKCAESKDQLEPTATS